MFFGFMVFAWFLLRVVESWPSSLAHGSDSWPSSFAHATVCSTDVYDQAEDQAGPRCPSGRLLGQSVEQIMKVCKFLT